MGKALILQTPEAMTSSDGVKLENYVGIEFVRNSSNGGGDNGYYQMIGDETLLETLPIFNEIKTCLVENAKVTAVLNQVNWFEDEDGNAVDLKGTDSDGNDYDVITVYPDMYAIIGGTNETYERYIFSDRAFTYDGDEAILISSWGQSPDYVTIVSSKSRSIIGGSGGTMDGPDENYVQDIADNIDTSNVLFNSSDGYPTQGSQCGFEAAAIYNNEDTSSPIPYYNGTAMDLEVMLGLMYVECRTKDLTSIFGYGITTIATPTEDNWDEVSGYKITYASGTVEYKSLTGTINVDGESGSVYIFNLILGGRNSHLQVMQGQTDVSQGGTFDPVYNADGDQIQGYDDGVMTGVYTKTIQVFLQNLLDPDDGTITTGIAELQLKVPIWRGQLVPYGNAEYLLSGYEIINYYSDDVAVNYLYRCPSYAENANAFTAAATINDRTYTSSSMSNLNPAVDYLPICNLGKVQGWASQGIQVPSNSSMGTVGRQLAIGLYDADTTAGMNNYESAYTQVKTYATSGTYTRLSCRFGGGITSNATPRYMSALLGGTASYDGYCGRMRVLIDQD